MGFNLWKATLNFAMSLALNLMFYISFKLVDNLLNSFSHDLIKPPTKINHQEKLPKKSPMKLLDLPVEVVFKIFRYLEPVDRYSCYHTCKFFRNVSMAQVFRLKKIPQLTGRGFRFHHIKPFFGGLTQHEQNLVLEFDASSPHWQRSSFAQHIRLPNLRTLELRNCRLELETTRSYVSSSFVPPLLNWLPKTLEKIHFHNCTTDEILGNILSYSMFLMLERSSRKYYQNIDLTDGKFPKLREIEISFNPPAEYQLFKDTLNNLTQSGNLRIDFLMEDDDERCQYWPWEDDLVMADFNEDARALMARFDLKNVLIELDYGAVGPRITATMV